MNRVNKYNSRIPQNRPLSLEICPIMNCNFDCRYCLEVGRRHTGSMDDETADAVVKFVRKRIKETKSNRLFIKWFGGEPTLEIERI